MWARRFLTIIFVLTLLAVAAAFAFFEWGGDILLKQATPKGHFHQARGNTGPDYSRAENWVSNPKLNPAGANDPAEWLPDGVTHGAVGQASVFYLHPTTYLTGDRWNAPIHTDPLTEARTILFVRSQASAFNSAGRIWAPRYRQAAYGAFLLNSDDAQKALDLAYGDVSAAFDEFLKQAPKDAPIILAAHSQGALQMLRLMHDKVAGRPVAQRIVAAYVAGWPISTMADLPALGLPACAAPEQTGCILSWMSFGDPPNASFFGQWEKTKGLAGGERRQDDALCVNPLTGTQNGAAPAQANRGTLIPTPNFRSATFQPGLVGARCANGLLVIDGDIPAFVPPPLPGNNFHIYDYALFWGSIRADAATRLAAWRR